VTAALALLQQGLPPVADTGSDLRLGYAAILGAIALYALWLYVRSRRSGEDRHAR
jgi:hypothetical protein